MFQELAKQAYAKKVTKNEQARQETNRRDIKRILDDTLQLFAELKIDHSKAMFDETSGVAVLDGVRFLGRRMYGKCPKCGEDALSDGLWGLENIGQMLTTFEPNNDHIFYQCPKRHDSDIEAHPIGESTSTSQVLADALVSFLRDHGYEHIDF